MASPPPPPLLPVNGTDPAGDDYGGASIAAGIGVMTLAAAVLAYSMNVQVAHGPDTSRLPRLAVY